MASGNALARQQTPVSARPAEVVAPLLRLVERGKVEPVHEQLPKNLASDITTDLKRPSFCGVYARSEAALAGSRRAGAGALRCS
jgi:hypothetical protein